eukprot:CAMPEP_0119349166 /NCGR_PEP_ID=MMETSP1333-20130426/109414_1 /TAXON_ID=418940 /ORGANISM="Scyphosphaera apsteinii, Strain RCC1455" /LENGTH=186 /DNA_ID=CAMNT_0007361761 /DNA_START=233 /DNA_END=794 /DNA_ORIENTATION=-
MISIPSAEDDAAERLAARAAYGPASFIRQLLVAMATLLLRGTCDGIVAPQWRTRATHGSPRRHQSVALVLCSSKLVCPPHRPGRRCGADRTLMLPQQKMGGGEVWLCLGREAANTTECHPRDGRNRFLPLFELWKRREFDAATAHHLVLHVSMAAMVTYYLAAAWLYRQESSGVTATMRGPPTTNW